MCFYLMGNAYSAPTPNCPYGVEKYSICHCNIGPFLSISLSADGALRMLQKVQTTSPYMSRARLAIANIYLEHKKDRREYIRCFKEMAAAVPSVHTLQLLGDAYIRIQESQKAIGAFEQALDLSVQTGGPLDPAIYSRIGTALVVCHDYEVQ
uniref:Uncharacterized protein n=1 Tax=Spongospora subterranea TaxID=70186 RepID=A0A0H5RA72_9EUKA|eukprot:CRZ05309.1 hypothetical protein [Spongospora subterranea]